MTALSMTHMGTGGNTSDQVHKTLHFSQEKSQIKSAFQELVAEYQVKIVFMSFLASVLI